MIRKLRTRHRIIWVILAIVLPIIFAASIIFRHYEPVNQTIPRRELSTDKH